MRDVVHIETVSIGHQRASSYEQIPKPRSSTNATVSMMIGIRGYKMLGLVPFPSHKHTIPRHKYLGKMADRRTLAILRAELSCSLTRTPSRPSDHSQAFGVDRYGTANREIGVTGHHGPTRHHQQLVHIRATGHNCLST